MTKPTKEEMLACLECAEDFYNDEAGETGCVCGKCKSGSNAALVFIRSLIEKDGDGGPKVKADDVRRMIQDAYDETDGEGIAYKTIFDFLRSIGVTVEEEKP